MFKLTRIVPTSVGLIVAAIILLPLIVGMVTTAGAADPATTLVSTPVDTTPVLDGNAGDTAWAAAPATIATVTGGWAGQVDVTMKSVYKDGMVYFLYQYSDTEKSIRRAPWQKQADGSWKKIPATLWPKPTCPVGDASCEQYWGMKDPNGAYEDKFAVLWNVNTPGFETQGCAITCHWGDDRANGKYGRKYTPNAGEIVDMWHFKSVRTAPVGQFDDQYIDNAQTGGDWGRHGDPKTSGGYTDNCYVNPSTGKCDWSVKPATGDGWSKMPTGDPTAPPWYILKSAETAFDNAAFEANDELASIRVAPFTGDRANLPTGSNYDEATHIWTMEVARPLITMGNDGVTASTKDVQFTNLDAQYSFGLAVFDNAQVEHSTSALFKLAFANCDTPTLSLSKTGVYWNGYADYTARILSVDYSVANGGANGAYSTTIVGTVNTNGVTTVNAPVALGDIAGGGSASATVRYNVPTEAGSFMSSVYATAGDACGNTNSYPGPMPSV
jgi:hypothetical protein